MFNDWARQMKDIRKFERRGSYGATNIFICSRTVMFATRNDFDWDRMLDGIEKKYRADFLKGLRERQEYEVPNQSGICLIRGFIADDGDKLFKANTAVRFAKQTDMRLEMLHGAVLQPGEPTLLERDLVSEKSALAKIFKTAGYRTTRQGRRNINGMSGMEKLIKWQGNKYILIWERDGGTPRIMMKFGANRTEGSSRNEVEILAILDTVLPTLKLIK